MRSERERASGEQGRGANRRVEMGEGRGRENRSGRHANEGVNRIPNGVDYRDLVCQKLYDVENGSSRNHPAAADKIEIARQLHQVEALQQPESQHRGVQVDA